MENFKSVLTKCKNIWFHKIKIRRKEGLFTEFELKTIDETINWTKREKNNIKEKVMYMAHDIFEPLYCPITQQKIKCYQPLYRKYTDEMIKNRCFISDKKIKEKLTYPFFENYCKEELEKILETLPKNIAIRYPMIINHCWLSLKEKGFDLNLIESNEEAFYLHVKKFKNFPLCKISNKKTKFNIKSMKYNDFFSKKEFHISLGLKNKGKKYSSDIIEKRKKTNLKKYGVESIFMLKDIQEKSLLARQKKSKEKQKSKVFDVRSTKEKWLDTIKKKYNVSCYKEFLNKKENYSNIKILQQKKFKSTLKKKYGVENIRNIKGIDEKIKKTCLEKYGTVSPLNTKEQKEKRKLKKKIDTYYNFSRFKNDCIPLFSLEEWLKNYQEKLPWKKTQTGEIFYCRYWGYPPIGKFKDSSLEKTIQKMLDCLNIQYEKNNRNIISPLELDFYLPEYQIGIECNGEYFHSTRTKEKYYHLIKKEECEKKKIRLINLFGKDIIKNEKKVFNLIKNITNKNKIKIGARKCFVVELSHSIAKKFLDKYHFQGYCNAHKHYALLYKNRILSVISIGKVRFIKNSEDLEIIRYATIKNVNVIGGFSKFIKHIKKTYSNKKLHTYADLNLFTGSVYEKAGFSYIKTTEPDFYYVGGHNHFISRYEAQKHKLKKLLNEKFDPNKTEEQNMNNAGYYRVYGCGNKYYTLDL